MARPSGYLPQFKTLCREIFDENKAERVQAMLSFVERQTAIDAAKLFGKIEGKTGSLLIDDAANVGAIFLLNSRALARELRLDRAKRRLLLDATRRGADRYMMAVHEATASPVGNAVETLWTKERIASATLAALASGEN